MVSIFKAVRDNDIELLRYFIQLSTGEQRSHGSHALPKEDIRWLQQHLKASGQKYYDLNKRSSKGRTALHCAVTWNRVEIAQLLLNCPHVNVNMRDRENGWTALHRCLYMGNIVIARMLLKREDIDLSIKDWEGLSAFELYDSTVADTYPHQRTLSKAAVESVDHDAEVASYGFHMEDGHVRKGGTDLYTWGHNTNYVLGHLDSENRTHPERVKLQLESQKSSYIMQRKPYLIESVTMSKYHMAILTTDASQNLLLCGFGSGGRLGTGKESDTQFTPVPVQWPERIASVALGRDHTIAVTENGNVISFGSNEYGQLGYETDNSPMQLVPRKIQAQSLKKQPILGAAASRVHSVVYTATDIFTFGYNQGQLGYHQPDSDPCQIVPRKVSMSTEILQVVANDNCTAVLNKWHQVILLCNYSQQKIIFPINRFPNNVLVHRSEASYTVKLIGSGTEHLGAIANTGDVYMWTCRSTHARNSESQQQQLGRKSSMSMVTTKISTPKRTWTLSKPHLAARDASIGQHGEVLVCTVSGHVFKGHSDSNGYKFTQIPHLQRCISVCANSSGAFAAIRSEYVIPFVPTLPPSTLKQDLSAALPHMAVADELATDLIDMQKAMANEWEQESLKYTTTALDGIQEDQDLAQYRDKQRALLQQRHSDLMLQATHDAWTRIDRSCIRDSTLDVVFRLHDKNIYCHSAILRCRSDIFNQLAKCADRTMNSSLKIKLNKRKDGRVEIAIENCQLTSLLLLIDYIYTDEYQHPMKAFFQIPALCFAGLDTFLRPSSDTIKRIQKDLVALSTLFQLPHLTSSAQSSFSHTPVPTLTADLRTLLEKQKGTDASIQTKEGDILQCHQMILRQRCSFFGNLFEPQSVWILDRLTDAAKNGGGAKVDLTHAPSEVIQTIIRYIYFDQDNIQDLFDDIERDREELMIQFLLTFLCESDYLLLKRLKAITEQALVPFIKLKTAATIFEHADAYLADNLKKACLQFISVNLPVFLGSSMLESIHVPLLKDLEDYIRQLQIKETPTVSRGQFNFDQDESYLEVEDTEFSSSLYALSRGDASAVSYDEIWVTLYPDKTSKESQHPKPTSPVTIAKSPVAIAKPSRKSMRVLPLVDEPLPSAAQPRRRSSAGWAAPDVVPDQQTRPSLREIIETENQPQTAVSAKNQKSPVLKKISQKERRRLAQQQESSMEASSSSSSSVWGKVPAVEAKPIAKIMMAESSDTAVVSNNNNNNNNKEPSADQKGKKIYIPEEDLDNLDQGSSSYSRHANMPEKDNVLFNPVDSFGSSFSLTPIRRYTLNKSQQESKKSFQTIQKQQELEEHWLKGDQPKKNILRIQKEEQTLASLSQYYIQTLDIMSGEWFEIHRLTR